jgi:uncharacterized membrane protein
MPSAAISNLSEKVGGERVGIGAIAIWAVLTAVAIAFILIYATRYFIHYDPATFGPFWSRRVALLLHITGGVVALLIAPWQFWSGYRRTPMAVHRLTGQIFLAAVSSGSAGGLYLASTTTLGWPFAFGITMLNLAWIVTTGMAYYAIRHRLIAVHREWMIRAYVVTFAFVIIRLFNDVLPTSQLAGSDLAITLSWASWVVPLSVVELIFQINRISRDLQPSRRSVEAV